MFYSIFSMLLVTVLGSSPQESYYEYIQKPCTPLQLNPFSINIKDKAHAYGNLLINLELKDVGAKSKSRSSKIKFSFESPIKQSIKPLPNGNSEYSLVLLPSYKKIFPKLVVSLGLMRFDISSKPSFRKKYKGLNVHLIFDKNHNIVILPSLDKTLRWISSTYNVKGIKPSTAEKLIKSLGLPRSISVFSINFPWYTGYTNKVAFEANTTSEVLKKISKYYGKNIASLVKRLISEENVNIDSIKLKVDEVSKISHADLSKATVDTKNVILFYSKLSYKKESTEVEFSMDRISTYTIMSNMLIDNAKVKVRFTLKIYKNNKLETNLKGKADLSFSKI